MGRSSRQAGAVTLRPDLPVGDWTALLVCCFRSLGRPMSCVLPAWAEPWRGSWSPRDPGFMNPTESKCIALVFASRGTWCSCFATGFTCYSWWLLPPRWLGVARIVERRVVIVSSSDRGDCEGFLTFLRRRAKRYSSGLLVAYVILVLCWLCGTLLRVWRVNLQVSESP